jgi:hypothetical protein
VVAKRAQRVDARQSAHALFFLGDDRSSEVHVQLLLHICQLTADDLHQFRRQVSREQLVGSPNDKIVDDCTEPLRRFVSALPLFLGSVWLPSMQDLALERLAKILGVTEHTRVDEIHHRIELEEVILHRGTREQHAALTGQLCQRLCGRCCVILQSVRLVAD